MSITTPGSYEFDVALSFAGEDRVLVEEIALQLKSQALKVFYDNDHLIEMWGEDLYVFLDEVYRKRAKFAVVFVSANYTRKSWTNHERQSVQARALEAERPYLLPIRLDSSTLPGLRPTISYLDARRFSASDLAQAIISKIRGIPGSVDPSNNPYRSPRSPEEVRELLAARPVGWEQMLFAGLLWQGKNNLEDRYREHIVGYVPRNGISVREGADMTNFVKSKMRHAASIASSIEKIFTNETTTRAFGPPGIPGDPDEIAYLARLATTFYGEILEWSSGVRGTTVPDSYMPVQEAMAKMVDQPVNDIRRFVHECIDAVDEIPEMLATGQPINLILTLDLIIPEEAGRRVRRAMYVAEGKRIPFGLRIKRQF